MTDYGPACSCITCSDEAIDMLVIAFDEQTGIARCTAPDGAESDVDAMLIESVAPGVRLMVHAGTAIALTPTTEVA